MNRKQGNSIAKKNECKNPEKLNQNAYKIESIVRITPRTHEIQPNYIQLKPTNMNPNPNSEIRK